MSPPATTPQLDDGHSPLLRLLVGEMGLLAALVLITAFFVVVDGMQPRGGHFSTMHNVRVILTGTSTVAVAALGMTMIIIAGGIDLSAGTAMTLCATVMALCLREDVPMPLAMLATLACGGLCGLINGVLISTLRIVPFIVTLGTMTIFLGVGKQIARESTVFPKRVQIPGWYQELSSSMPPDFVGDFLPRIPWGVWGVVALAVLVALVLHFTVFGRHVFALGSNESTARLCGVSIRRTKVAVYTLAGLLTGIAGMYHFSQLKIGNPVEGQGVELDIIAAVVIGGGSLSGGRGSVVGTLTGAAIMAVMRSGCRQIGISNPVQNIIIGVILIAAVAIDEFSRRRVQR